MNLNFIKLFLILSIFLIGCSFEDNSSRSDGLLEIISQSEKNISIDDLYSIGFKKNKIYDVSELKESLSAINGFWGIKRSEFKEYEIRIYKSHEEAISYGETLASEATGKEAIIDKDEATWKEGIKDRRKVGGPGGGGGGRSGIFPKYGNYAIHGNVIMLCEGTEEIALETCWDLINALKEVN